jgi:hypothetical protein
VERAHRQLKEALKSRLAGAAWPDHLPWVLQATQLCSVRGCSIHDGPVSILSAAEFLHRHQLPGFLLSLDFFLAYDRVSMDWVDSVLEAMGFGQVFRGWIAILHREAATFFLLHGVSPILAILFSIRQGDPLAALLLVIHLEPSWSGWRLS